MEEQERNKEFIDMAFNRYLVEIFNENRNITMVSLTEVNDYIATKFYNYNVPFNEECRRYIKEIFLKEIDNLI